MRFSPALRSFVLTMARPSVFSAMDFYFKISLLLD